MLSSSHTGVLKVAFMTMSPHNRAILEFFFAGAGKELFKMDQPNNADVLIIDYDHPGAEQEWENIHHKTTQPFILLSVHELNLENSIWVTKPLTSKSLTDAAEQVRELLDNQSNSPSNKLTAPEPKLPLQEPEPPKAQIPDTPLPPKIQPFGLGKQSLKRPPSPRPAPSPSTATKQRMVQSEPMLATNGFSSTIEDQQPPKKSLVQESKPSIEPTYDRVVDKTLSPEEQEQRWQVLCGDRKDAPQEDLTQEGGTFLIENNLLANLKQALQLANESQETVQVQLGNGEYLLLMPKSNHSYCTMDLQSKDFATLCGQVEQSQIVVHQPTSEDARGLELNALNDAKHVYDLEAFIWTASLLTSQGRLDQAVDTQQSLRLKHWPNLTRLEPIPHVMRIAALWNESAATVFDIAEKLAIPQRYVFAFHTAASTLNLLVVETVKQETSSQTKPKKNRGLFSRLLKRLLGGGAN